MKTSKVFSALAVAILVTGSIGACQGGSKPAGRIALSVKDGPPTSSDGRTITKLEIDITRIQLTSDGNDQNAVDAGMDNEQEDVIAFDAGTGAPHTVDLLKVTTFSELVSTASIPAGTYGGATLAISGARVVFADDPTKTVTLSLEGDGKSKAEFEFKFKPAAVVSTTGTTLAVIDFVPVVTKDAAGVYWVGHDGEHDQSGDAGDGGEVEIKSTIAAIAGTKVTLGTTPPLTVDVATATIVKSGAPATTADLAVGQKVELEGHLDRATSAITVTHLTIE